ncbi:unnamed protein product [Alopecurus aequalis]
MSASRKRAHTGGSTSAEDRLSALPDDLLHSIMSFLKARQVVQTCVLAKRWRHLWRSVPYLDIDLLEFYRHINDPTAIQAWYEKFVDLADYLLFHRHLDRAVLDTFRLHISATANTARHADAARWVRRGLKCSPRAFHFQNHHSDGYEPEIPLEFRSGPPSSCRLTKLHLLGLTLNSCFAEQISSVCVALEELELKTCEIRFQKVTSPSLKNLIIHCCRVPPSRRAPLNQLIITAPQLAFLHLKLEATYVFVLSVNEMLSLVKASIHNEIYYPDHVLQHNQCNLLSSLSNVTSLELLGFHRRLVPDEEPVEFLTFKNLTTLLLDDCELGDKFQVLRHFLQNSPNLERLVVKCCQVLCFHYCNPFFSACNLHECGVLLPKVLKRFQERKRKGQVEDNIPVSGCGPFQLLEAEVC